MTISLINIGYVLSVVLLVHPMARAIMMPLDILCPTLLWMHKPGTSSKCSWGSTRLKMNSMARLSLMPLTLYLGSCGSRISFKSVVPGAQLE